MTKVDGITPNGWFISGSNPGDYAVDVDKKIYHAGKASGSLFSTKKQTSGFATLMQDFDATKYRGKRMRFSAFVKSEKVEGWSGLWMRIEGAGRDSLGFDNMKNRQIKGTNDWAEYHIVLDVPEESKSIGFGILLSGTGKVWIDDVKFEEVDKKIATTNMEKPLKSSPTNLSFEE